MLKIQFVAATRCEVEAIGRVVGADATHASPVVAAQPLMYSKNSLNLNAVH